MAQASDQNDSSPSVRDPAVPKRMNFNGKLFCLSKSYFDIIL